MPNYIETATICQKELDEAAVVESCTGWMDSNTKNVIYNGGNEVKIPKLTMDGLADYDGNYVEGNIDFRYQTVTMTQDRGRGFTFDEITTDETNYALNIASAMGTFQREHVIPEIDAYRLSVIATKILDANKESTISGMAKGGYTPTANTTNFTVLKEIKTGIKAVREHYSGPLIIDRKSVV